MRLISVGVSPRCSAVMITRASSSLNSLYPRPWSRRGARSTDALRQSTPFEFQAHRVVLDVGQIT